MASAQGMIVGALLLALALGGCAGPGLDSPRMHASPYDASRGEPTWAVVPLRNESGTSLLAEDRISDAVVAAAAQTQGLRCLPLNRTLAAMRSLSMERVESPAQLRQLAAAMGADGIIVGSITEYDPYTPKLGLALALYAPPGALASGRSEPVDPRHLTYQPTDYDYFEGAAFQDDPLAVVSVYLDGKNHQVQMDVKDYATGRHDRRSALEWKRYLAIMDLYTEFAAWHAVGRLLDHEWIRLAGAGG